MQATDSDIRELIVAMDKKIDVFIAQNTEQLKRIEQRIDAVEINLTQRIDFTNQRIDTTNQRIESLEKTLKSDTASLEQRLNAQDTRLWGVVAGVTIALFGILAKLAFFSDLKV